MGMHRTLLFGNVMENQTEKNMEINRKQGLWCILDSRAAEN